MDLQLEDWGTYCELTGYDQYGGIEFDMNIYKPESNIARND